MAQEVEHLDKTQIEGYHIDIMDGEFVPNFGMGLQDLEAIRFLSDKQVDVHLMVQNPKVHLELFSRMGVDILYFHPEVDAHPIRTLNQIRAMGIAPGIAISTQTTVESIRHLLPYTEYVLLMSVVPGFSGQKFLEITSEKAAQLVSYQKDTAFKIVMDGAVSYDIIRYYGHRGVEGFVLGTSSLFGKDKAYGEIVEEIQAL